MSLCSDEALQQLIGALGSDDTNDLALVEHVLASYPDDARLHLLRGSVLAGKGRPIEAHAALSRAVELAPEFALARFQLGFFELTSGEAARALATWEPLDALPADHYLVHFATGLRHLIRDDFAESIAALRAGIDVNHENAPLNKDMQLVIDRCADLVPATEGDMVTRSEEASATSFLLDQFGAPGARH